MSFLCADHAQCFFCLSHCSCSYCFLCNNHAQHFFLSPLSDVLYFTSFLFSAVPIHAYTQEQRVFIISSTNVVKNFLCANHDQCFSVSHVAPAETFLCDDQAQYFLPYVYSVLLILLASLVPIHTHTPEQGFFYNVYRQCCQGFSVCCP